MSQTTQSNKPNQRRLRNRRKELRELIADGALPSRKDIEEVQQAIRDIDKMLGNQPKKRGKPTKQPSKRTKHYVPKPKNASKIFGTSIDERLDTSRVN